jgi:hypothetical protein
MGYAGQVKCKTSEENLKAIWWLMDKFIQKLMVHRKKSNRGIKKQLNALF